MCDAQIATNTNQQQIYRI